MINIHQAKCNGCAECVTVCPHHVLEVIEKKSNIAHEDRCIECGACQLNCLNGAIHVEKGTGCLFIIIKEDILKLKQGTCSCG